MNPDEKKRLEACLAEIAEILYNNSPPEKIKTLEGIEIRVRSEMLEYISPKIALFFVEKVTGINTGRKRKLKSCIGFIEISKRQANRLGLESYKRLSPLLEKCVFLVCANESYQNEASRSSNVDGSKSRS